MPEHDHEYALMARPNARVHVGFSTDAGTLTDATVTVAYAASGDDSEGAIMPPEGNGADDPDTATAEESPEAGIEWRGRTVEFYRDGDRVLDHDFTGIDFDGRADEGVAWLGRQGRRALDRVRRLRASAPLDRVRSGAGSIPVPQPDGTTLLVSLRRADATFECYKDDGDQWRWRLVREDESIAVSGTGYDSKDAARESIDRVKQHALGAPVEE